MLFKPLLWPTLTTLPLLALALGLGIWQVQRLEWKEALIARRVAGESAPAVFIDDLLAEAESLADIEYRAAKALGTFDHEHESRLYAIGENGAPGYRILTPLWRDDGDPLFVDRGFVPLELAGRATRADGLVAGDVAVHGVVRLSRERGLFQPDNQPADNLWFYPDLDAMADAAVQGRMLPVYLQADATPVPGGWPLGALPDVSLPNNHLSYAITWFGIAAALVTIYFIHHAQRGRLVLPIVRQQDGR